MSSVSEAGPPAIAASGLRVRWLVLGITSLILLLNYADRSALGVAGPAMMSDLGLTKTEFGLVSSIFAVGYAPFCFVGGWLSDRYGPRVVMGAAVGWWSIFTGMTAGWLTPRRTPRPSAPRTRRPRAWRAAP